MRVSNQLRTTARREARKGSAGHQSSAFRVDAPDHQASQAGSGSATRLSSLGTILALQEDSSRGRQTHSDERSQALSRGNAVLDQLGEVQHALAVDPAKLSMAMMKCSRMLDEQSSDVSEPNLQRILSAIETRARVELAKAEARQGSSGSGDNTPAAGQKGELAP